MKTPSKMVDSYHKFSKVFISYAAAKEKGVL